MKRIFISLFFFAFMWTAAGADASPELLFVRWPANPDAVWYSFRIVPVTQYFGRKEMRPPIYEDGHVFRDSVMIEKEITDSYDGPGILCCQVKAIGLDGQSISAYSAPVPMEKAAQEMERYAPKIRVKYHEQNGTVLLYPAYSFVKIPHAVSYEVEITDEEPENPDGCEPSVHRISQGIVTIPELFDELPRQGTVWWRVRGLDENGGPVGVWSEAEKIVNDPAENWETGILGDSISHGGGRMSYSPADWPYNYAYYLDFPTINISRSGDKTEDLLRRFDADVLPFHVRYLLIMGGTNNLRCGGTAEEVISDLEALQEKCRDNDIKPVLLTIPPIAPDRIWKYYHQPTAENWKVEFDKVNGWIRTQIHIDTAAPFAMYEDMPENLAADGLHPDKEAKEKMGKIINEKFPEIRKKISETKIQK